MDNNKRKSIGYVKSFVSKVYRRKLFQWIINKTIITLAILLTVYLFWSIFNSIFYMTQVEWKLFPLTLLFPLASFLFGKPNLTGTYEFLEKQIKELKGRLYLIMEPYPVAFDSKTYKKRAIKECASILKRKNIEKLTPIKLDSKYLTFVGLVILSLTIFFLTSGGIRLKRISETPVITYSDEKIKENQSTLILAKSNQLKRMYLFSDEGIKKMIDLGDGKFGIMARIKKTSFLQVGYRTWKSKKTRLEVIPSLFISELILEYQFPDYLKIKTFTDTLHNLKEEILIQALTGTKILFSGASNLTLLKMEGKVNNKSVKGTEFSGNFVLKKKERISVNLTDTSLFSSYNFSFFVDPIKDEPPYIEFLSPIEEYKLGESMAVPIILQTKDDYGLSSASLLYGKKKTELIIPAKTKFFEDSLTLTIKSLLPGDTLILRATATDLAGNETISSPILIYMPTLEEIFAEYRAVNDTLEINTSDIKEREEEITERIENLLYNSNLTNKNQYEIRKTLKEQKDLIEGMQKLADIAEEIRSPEIAKELDRIKELIDNPQVKDFLNNLNKTIEKPKISSEDLRNLNADQKDLLKTLDIFKKSLEYLKKLLELNEFSSRAEEIYRKQQEITSSKPDESLSNQQKALKGELENLIQEMQKSTDEAIRNIALEFKGTNTSGKMGKLADIMQKGIMNEKTAKEIEENLRNLNASLNNTRQQEAGEQLTESIKKKGWELSFILRTHNNLIDMKPGITKGLIEQGLLEALDKVDRELQELFLKTLGFSPDIFKDIRRAKEKMEALSLELTQKEVPRSSMERVNDPLIQAILKLFSAPPPSSQNLASALRQIIEQQNSIMNGLGKMVPVPVPDFKNAGDLKTLSEMQRQLAKDLRNLGNVFEPLSGEMDEMADYLESGILNKELIERQRKVLDRLLEAEEAIREGEISRRRQSEPGIFVSPGKVLLPENLGEEKKHLRELLEKRINESYPEEYKKEVDEYFRKLIE